MKILFRNNQYKVTKDEIEIASKYFDVIEYRNDPRISNSKVIGRYSVLPYYYEVERDLMFRNSTLVNNFHQHRYISGFYYYDDLIDYTPKTYFYIEDVPKPFPKNGMIIKGRTNSSKIWNYTYAKTQDDFYRIENFLNNNEHISNQGLIYREFVDLELVEEPAVPNSHPFVNEWRFFYYGKQKISHGFYWTMASDRAILQVEEKYKNDNEMIAFADKIAKIVSNNVNFFVLDIAKTKEGKWILIEVNDGQMAGFPNIDIDEFYYNLRIHCRTTEITNDNLHK